MERGEGSAGKGHSDCSPAGGQGSTASTTSTTERTSTNSVQGGTEIDREEEVEPAESPLDALRNPISVYVPDDVLKRVKVYEMHGESWADRGTGFCMGIVRSNRAYFLVRSEESRPGTGPGTVTLLESRIIKEDLYQMQQNTLIVWQELDGTDVALSFQEEEGCLEVWAFLRHCQRLLAGGVWEGPEYVSGVRDRDQPEGQQQDPGDKYAEDSLSEDGAGNGLGTDGLEPQQPLVLPPPELGRLGEIDDAIHLHLQIGSAARRESLAKFVLGEDYVPKLVALLEVAEDLESIADLHRLCSIAKSLVLLNDAAIFERILQEDVFLGVAGILEYDPDFPCHKAEHRKYLGDPDKFREVVTIPDPEIRRKIHQTFRLQYLKDVVLARILDDATFSNLNSLIYFNQVDIVQHLQHSDPFIAKLFGMFPSFESDSPDRDEREKKQTDAVCFIQHFCLISKLQVPTVRLSLYKVFIENGLFLVLDFALRHPQATIRLAGTDILMAVLDYDPKLVRSIVIARADEEEDTLVDTLVALLNREADSGVKAQVAEAIRFLLDPMAGPPIAGSHNQKPNDIILRQRKEDPEVERFLELFYSRNINALFASLIGDRDQEQQQQEPVQTAQGSRSGEESALFVHLCDLLCFFVRAHSFRSKFFVLSHNISASVSRVFQTREKHLKVAALRYFRTCIGQNDEFYNRHMIKHNLFEPIIDLVIQTARHDNLLNSAALEFFELIRRDTMKPLIIHIVENFRKRIASIEYVDTFKQMIQKYEQLMEPPPEPDSAEERMTTTGMTKGDEAGVGGRWSGVQSMSREQQRYFDGDEEEHIGPSRRRALVDYADNDNDEGDDEDRNNDEIDGNIRLEVEQTISEVAHAVEDKLGEKRRREEDEDGDEELGLLSRARKTPTPERSSDGTARGNASGSEKGSGKGHATGPKKILFSFGNASVGKEPKESKDSEQKS